MAHFRSMFGHFFLKKGFLFEMFSKSGKRSPAVPVPMKPPVKEQQTESDQKKVKKDPVVETKTEEPVKPKPKEKLNKDRK